MFQLLTHNSSKFKKSDCNLHVIEKKKNLIVYNKTNVFYYNVLQGMYEIRWISTFNPISTQRQNMKWATSYTSLKKN